METNLTTLLTSLGSLAIGTLIGSEVTRFFYKPKVVVKYKKSTPLMDHSGIYWTLQIENYGRTVAKNCVAVLSLYNFNKKDIVEPDLIDSYEDLPKYTNENIDLETPRNQIITNNHYRPIQRMSLCWSKLGNPDKIDINPGISQGVDLCKFHKHKESYYFIFPSEEGWRRVRVRVKSKEIEGHILICPSNEFPTRVNFKLSVSENGKSKFMANRPSFFHKFKKNKFD